MTTPLHEHEWRVLLPFGNAGFSLEPLELSHYSFRISRGASDDCIAVVARQVGEVAGERLRIAGNTLEMTFRLPSGSDSPATLDCRASCLQRMEQLVTLIALSDMRRCFDYSSSAAMTWKGSIFQPCVLFERCLTNHVTGMEDSAYIHIPQTISCKHVSNPHQLALNDQLIRWDEILRLWTAMPSVQDGATLIALSMARQCMSIRIGTAIDSAARLNLGISALEALLVPPKEHAYLWDSDPMRDLKQLLGNSRGCSSVSESSMCHIKQVRHDAVHRCGRSKDGSWAVTIKDLTTVENWLRWALWAKLNQSSSIDPNG